MRRIWVLFGFMISLSSYAEEVLDCRCKDWSCDSTTGKVSCADRNPAETFCAGVDNPEIGICCKEGETCENGVCVSLNPPITTVPPPITTVPPGPFKDCQEQGKEEYKITKLNWGTLRLFNGSNLKEKDDQEYLLNYEPDLYPNLPEVDYYIPSEKNECCNTAEEAGAPYNLYDLKQNRIDKRVEGYDGNEHCCPKGEQYYVFMEDKFTGPYRSIEVKDSSSVQKKETSKLDFWSRLYYIWGYLVKSNDMYKHAGNIDFECCAWDVPKKVYGYYNASTATYLCCHDGEDLITTTMKGKEVGQCCPRIDPEKGEVNKVTADQNTQRASGVNSSGVCCYGEIYENADGLKECCPEGSEVIDENYCCAVKTDNNGKELHAVGATSSGECCYGEIYEDADGNKACCPQGSEIVDENYCCEIKTDDNDEELHADGVYGEEPKQCCYGETYESVDGSLEGFKECCPEGSEVVDYNYCCEIKTDDNGEELHADGVYGEEEPKQCCYGKVIYEGCCAKDDTDWDEKIGCCKGKIYIDVFGQTQCCPEDSDVTSYQYCCPKVDPSTGEVNEEDASKNTKSADGAYGEGWPQCCYGKIYTDTNGEKQCCPSDKKVIGNGCCAKDDTDWDKDYGCCEGTIFCADGSCTCCSEGSFGYCSDKDETGECWETACCVEGGTVYKMWSDEESYSCCDTGFILTRKDVGVSECCSHEPQEIYPGSGKCCCAFGYEGCYWDDGSFDYGCCDCE